MITINNLSKKYNDTTVLDIENLQYKRSVCRACGITAGKTTLSLLLDLIEPTTDHIISSGVQLNEARTELIYQLL
jgi:ABC-2 type transport system ATP-binding protein